jgi:hypothetical protein
VPEHSAASFAPSASTVLLQRFNLAPRLHLRICHELARIALCGASTAMQALAHVKSHTAGLGISDVTLDGSFHAPRLALFAKIRFPIDNF